MHRRTTILHNNLAKFDLKVIIFEDASTVNDPKQVLNTFLPLFPIRTFIKMSKCSVPPIGSSRTTVKTHGPGPRLCLRAARFFKNASQNRLRNSTDLLVEQKSLLFRLNILGFDGTYSVLGALPLPQASPQAALFVLKSSSQNRLRNSIDLLIDF